MRNVQKRQFSGGVEMKRYTLYNDMFNARFYLYVGGTEDEFYKVAEKKHKCKIARNGAADGLCVMPFDATLIWLRNLDLSSAYDLGTLAHECLHACQLRLFDRAGITDRETFAYHLAWLVRGFIQAVQKKGKLINEK